MINTVRLFLIKPHWFLSSQFGFNGLLFLRSLRGLYGFLSDLRNFRKGYKGKIKLMPCLQDHYEEGGTTKSEYLWQDLLVAIGDWYVLLRLEILRLAGLKRYYGDWVWPLIYVYSLLGTSYFALRSNKQAEDLECIGWHFIAVKSAKNKSWFMYSGHDTILMSRK